MRLRSGPTVGGPHLTRTPRWSTLASLTYSLRMATTVHGIEAFKDLVGTHLGYSEWHLVDQAQINLFAEATGVHQWIHVDPERAKSGPFGGPIAHGYLTLALAPVYLGEVLVVEGISMGVNYGCNKVRFPSPALVGSRLRAGVALTELTHTDNGAQIVMRVTVEREGSDKPVCVADSVALPVR